MKSFIKKVLVAVNGTQESVHGAMYAIMLAKSLNASLKAVYVVDTATIKYLGINQILISEEERDFTKDLHYEGQNNLDYIKSLGSLKGIEIETQLLEGNVCSEIVKAAEQYGADFLVIGGKEKTKEVRYRDSSKNVLSTHKTEILSNAKCPVIVAQKENIEKDFKLF
ncbi:MAG: universal stress protein [Treponema sp.]|nr:universal stress protein [Treponema sp.]